MKTFTCLCLALVLAMVAGTANAALVAHYTFDEGSGPTAYDSAGTNDGTLHGSTWTTGINGGALSLGGVGANDYVSVPDNSSLRFSQSSSFSIAFWARPTSNGQVMGKMRTSGTGVFGYEVWWSNPLKEFQFVCESSGVANYGIGTGTNSTAIGNWYHVAAVYDNKDMKIYLNGTLVNGATFAYNTGSTTPNDTLAIGARVHDGSPEAGWYFGGKMDDVRIYNEALSGDAIAHIYQTTPEPATMAFFGLGGLLLRKRRAGY
ncbi:MAG: LamG-like jellyroll fold domain-containing protein [Sedimentisphaerales bacterium]|nr:LamG-like jellyroll fold domain-containing protein [Sedimentisphaerales bacterium]